MAAQGASNGGGDGEAPRGDVGFTGIDKLERIALTVGVDIDAVARAATLSRDSVISSAMTSSRSIPAARPAARVLLQQLAQASVLIAGGRSRSSVWTRTSRSCNGASVSVSRRSSWSGSGG